MEFVGVDVGNYKTVIASSKDNGKVYGDEQGKRSIKTIMELSMPIRRFGNSVTNDTENSLEVRSRSFRDSLSDKKDWGNFGMFMKYIDRVVKRNTPTHPPVCMTIPVYFKEKERRTLVDIANAMGFKLEGLVADISGMGMFACVRREGMPSQFLLFDFGYSKSTAGIFSFEKNVFKPLYTKAVKIGSMQFDEKLIDIIIEKHSLEKSQLIRERVKRNLDKIKTTLNSTKCCSIQLFITENPLEVVVTQDEYKEAVETYLNDLGSFVDSVMEETKFDGLIEVVGGNSISFLIKNMLKDKIKYQSTLDVSDASAIGAALGLACRSLRARYLLHDIVGREISIKIEGEDVNPTVIFSPTELIEGNPKKITYNRKGSFGIEILEDGEVISTLEIQKMETEEPKAIHVSFSIGKFGTVCVTSVECEDSVDYKYKPFGLSEIDMDDIKALEIKYRDEELGLERIGAMRNELETMAVGLGDVLYSRFGDIISEDELNTVKEVAMDLFDMAQSETVAQEEEVRNSILSRFEFVSKKLSDYEDAVSEDLRKHKEAIEEFKRENSKVFTPSFYKLQGLLYKLDEYLKTFDLNLFNVESFDGNFITEVKSDIQKYLEKAKAEVEEKKREAEKEKEKEDEKTKEKSEEDTSDDSKNKKESESKDNSHEESDVASIDE
ncbi:DnaK-like protein [Encephalitozoon intestinalis ATCC 50506]|uniref:DnaK-like protein n=1 Tax=Encephalitozoon intestinalis (strain ATCC 50506) TaxID=876142 RepID=E0SA50_ENCIT|nr:DnaK-like protein [Encephalitozoon intestinalis ATCC 50506]ADM12672.1 DnaK-like protein [Encephalitozoon intestinalis ATCC 50506]UTX46533.1 Hsp protein [Encephalitozoon intestinalis]